VALNTINKIKSNQYQNEWSSSKLVYHLNQRQYFVNSKMNCLTLIAYVLKKIKENNMTHMEKLQHPLLVFVHRYLAANRANISIDHPLIDYIDTQDLWS
jgi:hypothetical protein